ncbi:antitermination protein Q [Erwinia pyrifoliae]|uniref:antitermination protein Q n=1 Tax=Erwinia pyrifoliae TaxID=79967 RepID=UPI002204A953|nr:antitermination protein [Erwinia pyrifoliae]UWS28411.1 antitermination protein [Erwinia pyrifoliae]
MKIETALNYFNPKGQEITDDARTRAPDRLSASEVMAALAICQSRAGFGVSVWIGKMGISQQGGDEVISQLTRYAGKSAPALLRKAAGGKVAQCKRILATFAWHNYTRSAADRQVCGTCMGSGVNFMSTGVKLTGENVAPWANGRRPLKYQQQPGNSCATCHGTGTVSIRCRCSGSGRVRDIAASKRQGMPVEKICGYCGGRGFRRAPSSRVFSAIRCQVPQLTQSSWSRNWKPFYLQLIAKCEAEAALAAAEFRKITA